MQGQVNLFPIVILCGGLGTRVSPLTTKLPKSLIPIYGKPFIDYQLQLLKQNGFKKVILCIGYLGNLIQRHVGDGSQFGLSVFYSYDGDQLLGTANAIRKALFLLDSNFFVLYGDSYLLINYIDVQKAFIKQKKPALMTVYKNNDQGDKSNVLYKNKQIVRYSKNKPEKEMQHIDYGIGIFNTALFTNSNFMGVSDLSNFYHLLLARKQLSGFEVFQRFYEIGSPQGIKTLQNFLSEEVKIEY